MVDLRDKQHHLARQLHLWRVQLPERPTEFLPGEEPRRRWILRLFVHRALSRAPCIKLTGETRPRSGSSPQLKGPHYPALTREQYVNYVPYSFLSRALRQRGQNMVRSMVEEALALASLSLFLATVAVWAQVLGVI